MSPEAPYPRLEPVCVQMDIDSRDWAIWSGEGRPHGLLDRAGALLQGLPFRHSCIDIASDGWCVSLVPTYEFSTWDRFVVDREPRVRVTSFKGFLRITFGEQDTLIDGVLDVLRAAARKLAASQPAAAGTLADIAVRLDALRKAAVSPLPPSPSGRASQLVNAQLPRG